MTDELTALLSGTSAAVAPRLLGCRLVRTLGATEVSGQIVEVEAYSQEDAASHSYRGQTERTRVMFGPPGHSYIYFTYGMHYCCNIVTGAKGFGSGVLIRALEPLTGEPVMSRNRHGLSGVVLTNGPAKLCQALQIDRRLNGHNLRAGSLRLIIEPPLAQTDIVQTTRVGISKAQDVPWRFYIKDNPYVSKP